MSYRDLASQAEIRRGLVLNADFRRGADRVVKQNGVIVGSPVFTPVGVDLPGTAGNYVKYNIPSHMCDVMDSGDYLTVIYEFYPDLTYTTDAGWVYVSSTSGEEFYINKRPNANSNTMNVIVGGATVYIITTAQYGSLWNTGGRNQLVFSSADGDTDVWFNGSNMVSSDPSAYNYTMQPTELHVGMYNDGTSNPFPGVVSFVKVFKGPKFTTDEVSAYWNHKITARPEEAASYWFFDGARHDVTNVRTLDITHNERHLTFGDGGTSTTYPTKLTKHGYSFDGGDYLNGSANPELQSSGSFTVEVFFKSSDITGDIGLIAKADTASPYRVSFGLKVDDGKPEFLFRAFDDTNREWSATGSPIFPGQLYHIVLRHTFGDANSTSMLINGVEEPGSWAASGGDQPLVDTGRLWRVGIWRLVPAIELPFTGDIYHAGIWEERLTTIECYDLYLKALRRRNNV